MHNILRDFEIRTDHRTPARSPDLVIFNKTKRTCCIVDFVVSLDYRVKIIENKNRDKYLELGRELRKL